MDKNLQSSKDIHKKKKIDEFIIDKTLIKVCSALFDYGLYYQTNKKRDFLEMVQLMIIFLLKE